MASKVTYKLKLSDVVDTKGLNASEKNTLKKEIGEFIQDLILEDTSNQRSAVTGRLWKSLSKDYKKIKQKVAPGVANLELTGDMLDALEVRPYAQGIEIGVFNRQQAMKADGHNHTRVFGVSKLPPRKFIPRQDEKFRPGIMKEVTILAKDLKDGFESE